MAMDRAYQGRRQGRFASPAGIAGWLLFDCATQPFFTLVTTFVFAPYFTAFVAPDPVSGQALWGYATSSAGLVIALTAPILGAVADQAGARKPWIMVFGALMALASALLWFTAPGLPMSVPIALIAYAVGTIAVEYATVFNNAMMPTLVPPERLGRLSGTGWAIGYLGGLFSLAFVLTCLAADPQSGKTLIGIDPLFGLDPATHEGDRASGPYGALWFFVFVLPLLAFTPDRPRGASLRNAVRSGLSNLGHTLKGLPDRRNLARFLIANMIYTDGLIALFAFGGVYAAGMFGWTTIELGIFGILIIVAATVGAFIGGRLDDSLGSKTVVLSSLAFLTLSTVGILSTAPDRLFGLIAVAPPMAGDGLFGSVPERLYLGLGCLIGIASGPVQAASRTLLCRLVPESGAGQYFGLFALTGKITSFMGPLAIALATDLTQSQRFGIVPLIAFFVIGGLLLAGVDPSARED